jgi:hypothetical protein
MLSKINIFFAVILLLLLLGCNISTLEPVEDPMVNLTLPSKTISGPSPLTGIVLWDDNGKMSQYKSAIALEFKYFYYSDIVSGNPTSGYTYNWTALKNYLNTAMQRGHHGIVRFRDTDPDLAANTSTVPSALNKVKRTASYSEGIEGSSAKTVTFPDWSNPELADFMVDFYQKLALEFDGKNNGIAYLEIGFGLWAEYHIDYGNMSNFSDSSTNTLQGALGKLFPSKAQQTRILTTINAAFKDIPWGISIDAADTSFSAFSSSNRTLGLNFGLFDDSLLHEGWLTVNGNNWQFFENQYKKTCNGGEFSYYTYEDQQTALNPNGPHGVSLAQAAAMRALTFVIGSDQPEYKSVSEVNQASRLLGYKLTIVSARANQNSTEVVIKNDGVAGVFFDMYPARGQVKSSTSLRGLLPGQSITLTIPAGGSDASNFYIGSPKLLANQIIPYTGN